jgi:hypothetical protein
VHGSVAIAIPLVGKRRVHVRARIDEKIPSVDLQLDRQRVVVAVPGRPFGARSAADSKEKTRSPEHVMSELRVNGALNVVECAPGHSELETPAIFLGQTLNFTKKRLEIELLVDNRGNWRC